MKSNRKKYIYILYINNPITVLYAWSQHHAVSQLNFNREKTRPHAQTPLAPGRLTDDFTCSWLVPSLLCGAALCLTRKHWCAHEPAFRPLPRSPQPTGAPCRASPTLVFPVQDPQSHPTASGSESQSALLDLKLKTPKPDLLGFSIHPYSSRVLSLCGVTTIREIMWPETPVNLAYSCPTGHFRASSLTAFPVNQEHIRRVESVPSCPCLGTTALV